MSPNIDLELMMTDDDRTLGAILQWRARQQPDDTAYIYLKGGELDEIGVTYGELDRQARTVAAALQGTCRPGDRAILLYPPGLEFIAAFFGCLYAGVIAVPAYPPKANRNLSRLRDIVGDCQAVVALSTRQIGNSIQGHWSELHWIATDTLDGATAASWQNPSIAKNAIAFLQYTSGSTGTPRGVMVSHRNLVHNSECIRERWGHSPSSVGICWVPQFHDLGLIIGILQPLYVGYKAVLMSPTAFVQKPFRWLQAISRYRGTTTCGPNFSFDLCVSKVTPEQRATLDLSSLDTVMNGAEPVLTETLQNFAEAFGPCGFDIRAFRGGYGLAEGTVFVTTSHRLPKGPNVKSLSKAALEQHLVVRAAGATEHDTQDVVGCGPAAGDQELAVVHPDLHTRCKPDQIGEIWVKGESVGQGYWQRPEESAQTFGAFLDDTREGPFLRTGDLGFLHEGELYVTGRTKDLIIVRGRNHYPQDIERTVETVHPALRLNCTAAFSVREQGEERVVVVQELKRDHAGVDLEPLAADIFRAVAEEHELSLHALLLIADGNISKTSSGKIQRSTCRQRYEEGSFQVLQQTTFAVATKRHRVDRAAFLERFQRLDAEECRAQVELYLIQTLRSIRQGFFYIDVHQPLVKMGLDSLGVAEVRSALEDDLGLAFPIPTLMDMSLRDLSEEILRAASTASTDAVRKTAGGLSDAEVTSLLDDMLSLEGSGRA
ncbi:AMP-binding protein [Pendulispora rubella]|uniref:AMP-binding protein n=1 Tax=Pendulispora rubella TaxID=2741070 RepID=A0ABZ2KSP5_9BACT